VGVGRDRVGVGKTLVRVGEGVTDAAAWEAGVTAVWACGIFIIKMRTPRPSTQMSAIARTASKMICRADMLHLPDVH